jgi:FkbM family methyltransferase
LLTKVIYLIKKSITKFVFSLTQRSVCKVKGSFGIDLIRLGSEYGGYWIPRIFLDSEKSKSAVSLGLGFDVSLDIELLNSGFIVLGVEPTKKSTEFVTNSLRRYIQADKFHLVKSAVGGRSGKILYDKPNLKNNYQWWAEESGNEINNRVEILTATLDDLEVLYPRFFQKEIVVLKMDIEGAEIGVLRNLVDRRHQFDYLAIELDYISLVPMRSLFIRLKRVVEVRRLLISIETRGYTLLKREEFNYFFINNRYIQASTHA